MKRLLIFLMFCFLAIPVFASDGGQIDIPQYFVSLSVFAPLVVIITEFIKANIKIENNQLLSWIVSVLLSAVGWFLQLGMFAGVAWYWIFIYGLSSGLVANGIFDISIVQAILNLFKKE